MIFVDYKFKRGRSILENLSVKPIHSLIGKSILRKEDPLLLSGRGTFTDDVRLPGQLYVSILRSPYAHALINSVDLSRASNASGVVRVLDGEELSKNVDPLPVIFSFHGTKVPKHRALAQGRVRYVGEPVAAIVATSRGAAEDAREEVLIDYAPLNAVTNAERAADGNAPGLHEDIDRNVVYQETIKSGDVISAFKDATYCIERTIRTHRCTGAAIEPRSVTANFDGEILTVHSATQVPHTLRRVLARCLRLDESKVRVVVRYVGGSFGNYKYHPEDIIVSYCALVLGRPVKWSADRSEIFKGNYHAREQVHRVSLAADRDGVILGLRDHILADHGAYLPREGVGPSIITSLMLPGPYMIRNVEITLECVLTNKTPTGALRGFGQPEACFVMERMLDALAREARIDRAEARSRNFIRPEEFPYSSATGLTYDSGRYEECLRRALSEVGYGIWGEEERKLLERPSKKLGLGFAVYTENTGFGPTPMLSALGVKQEGFEEALVDFDDMGRVRVRCGMSPHGQGLETTLAQVAADQLELPLDGVVLEYGDTSSCPEGQGTFASRGSVVGSALMVSAATDFLTKAKKVASEILGVDSIAYSGGTFFSAYETSRRLSWKDLREHSGSAIQGLSTHTRYDPKGMAFPYAAHAALVEIDEETGKVKVLKYAVCHDCGPLINPMIVEGEVVGGTVQGISGALLEEIPYSAEGEPLASTFIDYLIATSVDAPNIQVTHLETPSPLNVLGVKGTGEGGAIAPMAVIASAVEDALSGESGALCSSFSMERTWNTIKHRWSHRS